MTLRLPPTRPNEIFDALEREERERRQGVRAVSPSGRSSGLSDKLYRSPPKISAHGR
jgi:hypothetical protein